MRSVMVLAGLVAIACSAACAANGGGGSSQGGESSSEDGNGGANEGEGGSLGSLSNGGAPSDGGSPSNPSGAGGSPDEGCTGEGDFQACAQCFAGEDPAGGQAYQGTLLSECACTNPDGDCYAACSGDPVCSGQQPGAACNSCIQTLSNASACVADFSTACSSDPSCTAFANKLASCPQ